MRKAALVIGCSDSDLHNRIAYNWSEGGGLNLLRVTINRMAERHGHGQGMMGRRKGLLIRRGHHNNDMGAH